MRTKQQKATPPTTPGNHKRPRCVLVDTEEQFFTDNDTQTPIHEKLIRTVFRTQDIEEVVEAENEYVNESEREGILFTPLFDCRRDNAVQQLTGECNYLVAKDLGSDGAKSFAAAPRECIRDIVLKSSFENRNYYAVVPPNTPTDLYIDVDYKVPIGEAALFLTNSFEALRDFAEQLILNILKRIIKCLNTIHNTTLSDLVVLQSCTSAKISFHVHGCLSDGKAFVDSSSLQGFLRTTFYSKNCLVNEHSQQLSDGSEISSLEQVAFSSVDLAPYSRFACFRLPLCTKKGKFSRLIHLSKATNCELDMLLRKYAPVILSDGHLVDYCLITKPEMVTCMDYLVVHKVAFQGEASNRNSGVPRQRNVSCLPNSNETVTSPAVLEICRMLFLFVSSKYSVLSCSDLTVRKSGYLYKIFQKKTTWCLQACKHHTHATTYLIVSDKAVAAHCWSSNCMRIVVIQINTLPKEFREKFLLACYPSILKK